MNTQLYFIEKTAEFDKWLRKLKDFKARARILLRIQRIESNGHFGDYRTLGDGIREIKINHAKGYRIYFTERAGKVIMLLFGGDKSTQTRDIEKARSILKRISKRDENFQI